MPVPPPPRWAKWLVLVLRPPPTRWAEWLVLVPPPGGPIGGSERPSRGRSPVRELSGAETSPRGQRLDEVLPFEFTNFDLRVAAYPRSSTACGSRRGEEGSRKENEASRLAEAEGIG